MKIAFLNPQGNFDENDSYLTEHADFGGQLVYVKETAKTMANIGIEVDIITRQIVDKNWKGFEDQLDTYEDVDNLRIIRIPFGGKKFLNKEKLWPYIEYYVDEIINFYNKEGSFPKFFTAHYGDGGLAAAMLYDRQKIPYSFTGHSLGAQKIDKLEVNKDNILQLNKKYNFSLRIIAERISMANSAINIVSTNQERLEQYNHHLYNDVVDVKDDSKFAVIPPGVNISLFNTNGQNDQEAIVQDKINNMFNRDIFNDRIDLPVIVASSRLSPKKNHVGLIKAYAKNIKVQEKYNMVIILRGINNPFDDYSYAKLEEKNILDEIMSIIKYNNLEGKISMFSLDSQKQLASCYRILAKRKSVFSLTALYEPFGLAPIEAMACGLPAVVTKNGGPTEVLQEADKKYGILVDPSDTNDIARGLLEIHKDNKTYKKYQNLAIERVHNKYTWENTARNYIKQIEDKISQANDGEDFSYLSLDPFFKFLDNTNCGLEWLKYNYLKDDNK